MPARADTVRQSSATDRNCSHRGGVGREEEPEIWTRSLARFILWRPISGIGRTDYSKNTKLTAQNDEE